MGNCKVLKVKENLNCQVLIATYICIFCKTHVPLPWSGSPPSAICLHRYRRSTSALWASQSRFAMVVHLFWRNIKVLDLILVKRYAEDLARGRDIIWMAGGLRWDWAPNLRHPSTLCYSVLLIRRPYSYRDWGRTKSDCIIIHFQSDNRTLWGLRVKIACWLALSQIRYNLGTIISP